MEPWPGLIGQAGDGGGKARSSRTTVQEGSGPRLTSATCDVVICRRRRREFTGMLAEVMFA